MISYILKNGGILKHINIPNYTNSEYSFFNPSVCAIDDKLIYSIRSSNYDMILRNNFLQLTPQADKISSELYLFNNIDNPNIKRVIGSDYRGNDFMSGVEDCRLFEYNGDLYGQCSIGDSRNEMKIQVFKFDFQESNIIYNECLNTTEQNFNNLEKNWMYIPDTNFEFIYWLNRYKVIYNNQYELKSIGAGDFNLNHLRGSSKLVKYKDGYLCIAHNSQRHVSNTSGYDELKYNNYLLYLNQDLVIEKVSSNISFSNSFGTQFSPGLEIFNDKVYITFSVLDCVSFELSFDVKLLDSLLEQQSLFEEVNDDDFTKFLTTKNIDIYYYRDFFEELNNKSLVRTLDSIIKNK